MRLLRAAAVYFACVFGAGFVLGAIRVSLLVPRLGERTAELLELPVMLLVIAWVSRWRQRRTAALRPAQQLAVGAIAWLLLFVAEIALGVAATGRPPVDVVLAHDPVSGSLYYASTAVFAVAPWFWCRRRRAAPGAPASAASG